MAYHDDHFRAVRAMQTSKSDALGGVGWILLAVLVTFAAVALLSPETSPDLGGDGTRMIEDWHGNSATIRPAE